MLDSPAPPSPVELRPDHLFRSESLRDPLPQISELINFADRADELRSWVRARGAPPRLL